MITRLGRAGRDAALRRKLAIGEAAKVSFSASCAALQLRENVGVEPVGLLLRDDARLDEPLRVQLAHGRVRGDRGGEQRLRVGGLVLLVVPVPAVADEVDDDVVRRSGAGRRARAGSAEIAASGSSALTWMIGTSKPFARSLEYRVERPSAGSVVKPTWLLRDQVQRAARRVAGEALRG